MQIYRKVTLRSILNENYTGEGYDEQNDQTDLAFLPYSVVFADPDLVQPADRYTAASYAPYESAYAQAKALFDGGNVTAIAADRAVDALSSAKKALVLKNDFSELRGQIAFYETLDGSKYTKASFEKYTQAYEHAKAVLEIDSSSQSEINSAASAMNSAKSSLMEIPDMSELRALVERQVDKTLYTTASFGAYEEAIRKGKALLEIECPTLAEIKLAENMIAEAFASLVKKGDTDALAALVAQVKEEILVPDPSGREAKDHFAKTGYEMTKTALSNAEKCLKSGDSSETSLQSAERNLRAAVASLVDITPLFDAYDEGGRFSSTFDQKEYTVESYQRLSVAMAACNALMNKADVTSAEVKTASDELYDVIAHMERVSIVPDGALDKPLGDLRVKAGSSVVTLGAYMTDYTAYFKTLYLYEQDFAYNVRDDAVTFTKGKIKLTLSENRLLIEYTGSSPVAAADSSTVSFNGAHVGFKESALVSPEIFGVPTEYTVKSERVQGKMKKIAALTYVNESDNLKVIVRYNTEDEYVISVECVYTPPQEQEEPVFPAARFSGAEFR